MNKELLNNPEVKEIATEYAKKNMFNGILGNNNLSNWDDFVKAQEPEKEWEILSFKDLRGDKDTFFTLKSSKGYSFCDIEDFVDADFDGVHLSSMLSVGECVASGHFSIHSVERLSDGEVFTIGDNTFVGEIEKFEIHCGTMVVIGKEFRWSIGAVIKNKPPLFVTEDGVSLYNYGEPMILLSLTNWLTSKVGACEHPFKGLLGEEFKYFSTPQAANDWVVLNKPSLSPAELVSSGIINQGSPQYDKILKLAKSK